MVWTSPTPITNASTPTWIGGWTPCKVLAQYLTELTGLEIPFNRKAIQVSYDDMILLVSMNGRLPEHPTFVDYKGRLNYTLVRFGKQSQANFIESMMKIEEIKEAC